MASLGYLDGDGVGDLAVGATGDDDGGRLSGRGAVWILFFDGVAAPRVDLNCDGAFDGADIDPFFLALVDAEAYAAAFPDCNRMLGDMNADGFFDGADIDRFFECLVGGQCP